MNQILLAIIKMLIFEFKISKNFWAFAVKTVYYIRNWTVIMTEVNESNEETKMKKISYKLWTDKKLYIVHMKIWECKCWIHVSLKQNADKLNFQSVKNIFINYTENLNQYLIWMSERKKVIKTTNSIFIENQQRISESRISESVELEKAQQEKAQQEKAQHIEILSLDNDVTENSSDENDKNSNSINNENIDENNS